MIRGGLRSRLVLDSFRVAVIAALTELGWFDDGRAHQPLRYITQPVPWQDELKPNAMAITAENIEDVDRGLGGEVEDVTRVYIDIYGESDQFSYHLARDIRDVLQGRLGTVVAGPVVDAYDLRQPTPAVFTSVELEGVFIDRARSALHAWQAHWFMVRVDLIDDYGDEFTEEDPVTTWTEDLRPAWDAVQILTVAAP